MGFLSQKRAPSVNFVEILKYSEKFEKEKKYTFIKPLEGGGGRRFMKLFHKIDFLKDGFPEPKRYLGPFGCITIAVF